MFRQYSHNSRHNNNERASEAACTEFSTPYPSLSITAHQILEAPATAQLHHPLKSPQEIDLDPPIEYGQLPSLSASYISNPSSLSRTESRGVRSFGNEQSAVDRGSDWRSRLQHHRHVADAHDQPKESVDLEKASVDCGRSNSPGSQTRVKIYAFTSDELLGRGARTEQHAVWILIYLSFLSPFLTFLIAMYTILITPELLLLALFSFFTSYPPLRTHVHTFLAPPVNFQLELIFSGTHISNPAASKPLMLVLLNLLSPIYALGIAVSASVAAMFWFYAAILGDPDGRDGWDDGRAAVLEVRRWWERWLKRASNSTEDAICHNG